MQEYQSVVLRDEKNISDHEGRQSKVGHTIPSFGRYASTVCCLFTRRIPLQMASYQTWFTDCLDLWLHTTKVNSYDMIMKSARKDLDVSDSDHGCITV